MHPIFLEIGPVTIRWYGVMAAVGFLLATVLINLNRKRANLSENQASTLIFITIFGGIIGARIFYVIQNWSSQFSNNWLEIFRIDHGGLVFYGGFFLAVAGITTYCRLSKLDTIRVMDVFPRTGDGACDGQGRLLFKCLLFWESDFFMPWRTLSTRLGSSD